MLEQMMLGIVICYLLGGALLGLALLVVWIPMIPGQLKTWGKTTYIGIKYNIQHPIYWYDREEAAFREKDLRQRSAGK